MSNFKYQVKGNDCWLVFGDYRMKIRWNKRWIQPGSTIVTIPSSITLNKSSIEFTSFTTETLTATVTPTSYSGTLVWSSSDESVATVSTVGVVTPIEYQVQPAEYPTCTITCKSSLDNSVKATCFVKVKVDLAPAPEGQ